MQKIRVDTMSDLRRYIDANGAPIIDNRKDDMERLTHFFDTILSVKTYHGPFAKARTLCARVMPLRYLIASYDAKISYSSVSKKQKNNYSEQAIQDIKANYEKYVETYELLDDDSKRFYLAILMFRITGAFRYIVESATDNEQYFSNKILWPEKTSVIDCGAFTGDTLLAFLEKNISLENYYLYELEDENYKVLLQSCDKARKNGVRVFPKQKGVYSRNTVLYFEADADSSKIVDYETGTSISVVALDDEINTPVTFIKMDIEGSELEAIEGAKSVICRYKPTLAICIYHKQEDFWKIPLRIKEICPEYTKFWIEHYTCSYIETVLYVSA